MSDLDDIVEEVQDLIEDSKDNLLMMQGMDDMDDMNHTLPASLMNPDGSPRDDIRKETSPAPHNALKDGTSLFDSFFPKLRVVPLSKNEDDIIRANQIERALDWTLKKALKRTSRVQSTIVKHAMKYGMVAAQLVYLPHQKQSMLGENKLRKSAIMSFGPYALIVRNPKTVFPTFSDYGLEGVTMRTLVKASEVFDFWGEKNTKKLKKILGRKDYDGIEYVTLYDKTTFDRRTVYASPDRKESGQAEGDEVLIFDEELDTKFLPWIVRTEGEKLQPFLYPLWKAGLWDTLNVLATLRMSDILGYAMSPRSVTRTPTGEASEISYDGGQANVAQRTGEEYQQLVPPQMNQSFTQLINEVQEEINKSTLPALIGNADVPAGTAFASIRELVQLSTKTLNKPTDLAQWFYEDVYKQMLQWLNHDKGELVSFVEDRRGEGAEEIIIKGGEFDPNDLEMNVELKADIPRDDVADINAAKMALEAGLSLETALDRMGVDDPKGEIERKRRHDLVEAGHQAELFTIQSDAETIAAVKQQEALTISQFQLQQELAAAAQEQQQQDQPQDLRGELRNPETQQQFTQQRGAPGFENLGGDEFNPAVGGTPPEIGNPSGAPLAKVRDA